MASYFLRRRAVPLTPQELNQLRTIVTGYTPNEVARRQIKWIQGNNPVHIGRKRITNAEFNKINAAEKRRLWNNRTKVPVLSANKANGLLTQLRRLESHKIQVLKIKNFRNALVNHRINSREKLNTITNSEKLRLIENFAQVENVHPGGTARRISARTGIDPSDISAAWSTLITAARHGTFPAVKRVLVQKGIVNNSVDAAVVAHALIAIWNEPRTSPVRAAAGRIVASVGYGFATRPGEGRGIGKALLSGAIHELGDWVKKHPGQIVNQAVLRSIQAAMVAQATRTLVLPLAAAAAATVVRGTKQHHKKIAIGGLAAALGFALYRKFRGKPKSPARRPSPRQSPARRPNPVPEIQPVNNNRAPSRRSSGSSYYSASSSPNRTRN